MNKFRIMIITGIITGLLLFSGIIYLSNTLSYVEQSEMPFTFDKISGEVKVLYKKGTQDPLSGDYESGWIRHGFFTKVYTINLLPFQICIRGEGVVAGRVLNCKLLQFDPVGFNQLIENHGVMTYSDIIIKDILFIYAYDENPEQFKFVKSAKANPQIKSINSTLGNEETTDQHE